MALKKDKKAKYEGPKLAGDTAAARIEREKRALARAQKNAGTDVSNEIFALQDPAFIAACEAGKVKATGRQASKWRNGYGAARKAAMKS
jgi:hypothetical protein